MKNDDIEQQLNKIINDKMIYPVYQPIISGRFSLTASNSSP